MHPRDDKRWDKKKGAMTRQSVALGWDFSPGLVLLISSWFLLKLTFWLLYIYIHLYIGARPSSHSIVAKRNKDHFIPNISLFSFIFGLGTGTFEETTPPINL